MKVSNFIIIINEDNVEYDFTEISILNKIKIILAILRKKRLVVRGKNIFKSKQEIAEMRGEK